MTLVITAFLLGLASALHCAVMCGPLLFLFFGTPNSKTYFFNSFLLYGMGKTMAYASLGILIGLVGFSLRVSIPQKIMSIMAGLLMLAFVLFPFLATKFSVLEKWNNGIKNKITHFLSRRKFNYFLLGFFNGLLPCGVVYMALMASLAFDGVVNGVVFMAVFGLATLPTLAIIAFMKRTIRIQYKQSFAKLSKWATILIAIFLIVRGVQVNVKAIDSQSITHKAISCGMH